MLLLSAEANYRFHSGYIQGKPDECWNWLKSCTTGGYGHLSITHTMNGVKKTYIGAHRYSLMLKLGVTTLKTEDKACHTCDNPKCVNPNHLYLGDNRQNFQDAIDRGRSVHVNGEKHGRCKLTEEQVIKIKLYIYRNIPYRKIAEMFGISDGHVGDIAKGRRWAHLK